MLHLPARDLVYAAIDFETTGLDPDKGHRVLEVAVVRGRMDASPEEWSQLVNPGRPVDATAVHGIEQHHVDGKPTFAQVLPEVTRRLDGAVLVAHNANFDLAFLERECDIARAVMPVPPVLDSLGLARRILALGDHRLSSLVQRFGIPCPTSHRALDDARATWLLARMLLRQAGSDTGLTLGEAIRLCARRTTAEVEALYRSLERARKEGQPVTVDYSSPYREAGPVRRDITIQRLNRREVRAYCHLRGANRTFRLDRITLVDA